MTLRKRPIRRPVSAKDLRALPLFRTLSPAALSSLSRIVRERQYATGAVVEKEGAPAKTLYVILSGKVEARAAVDRREKLFKTLAILGRGEVVGETALFEKRRRTADLVARTPLTLLCISQRDFFSFWKKDLQAASSVALAIIGPLLQRLHQTSRELATIHDTGKMSVTLQDPVTLVGSLLERLMKEVGTAEAGLCAVWNEFNREYEVLHQIGQIVTEGEGKGLRREDPVIIWIEGLKEPFLTDDLPLDLPPGLPPAAVSGSAFFACRSLLVVPMHLRDSVKGFVLLLHRSRRAAFSFAHLILVSAVCEQAVLALENIMHRQEQQARERLARAKGLLAR